MLGRSLATPVIPHFSRCHSSNWGAVFHSPVPFSTGKGKGPMWFILSMYGLTAQQRLSHDAPPIATKQLKEFTA